MVSYRSIGSQPLGPIDQSCKGELVERWGWVYHTVLTKVEACIVGSFVIKSRCKNRAVPAIKRSCNSGMSVMCAAAWITAKLIGYSR